MLQPVVSVIIPLFNRKDLIEETLQSVVDQTFQNWEAIVVDDGSTDHSCEIVKKWAKRDSRIQLVERNREPKGAPTCRNIGFKLAKGQYVVFLDSDDLLASFCLEQRIPLIDSQPAIDFLVFPIVLFQQERYDLLKLWNIETQENTLLRFLKTDALWQTMGPIYRKSSLIKLPYLFDEQLAYWQDYDLHLRILFSGMTYKFMSTHVPDCYHRRHQNTISQSGKTSPMIIQSRLKVLQKTGEILVKNKYEKIYLNNYKKTLITTGFFELRYSGGHLVYLRLLIKYTLSGIFTVYDFCLLLIKLSLPRLYSIKLLRKFIEKTDKKIRQRYSLRVLTAQIDVPDYETRILKNNDPYKK